MNRKDNELNKKTNYQININTLKDNEFNKKNDELNRHNDEFKLCFEYKKDFDECFKKFK